jgi:hypothetical protein
MPKGSYLRGWQQGRDESGFCRSKRAKLSLRLREAAAQWASA